MRRSNCQTIRQEIEEANPGQLLSRPTQTHIQQCSSCLEFSLDDSKLRQLVASLDPVKAPSDFDYRLRARLASEKDGPGRRLFDGSFSPFLTTSAVTLLLLLVGGGLVMYLQRSPIPAPTESIALSNENATVQKTKETKGPTETEEPVKNETQVVHNLSPTRVKKPSSSLPRLVSQTPKMTVVADKKLATQDSALEVAPRFGRTDYVTRGSAFAIPASYQSMKVSLDDGSGVPRTILLPTVSFGSQRLLSGANSPLQSSPKGNWY